MKSVELVLTVAAIALILWPIIGATCAGLINVYYTRKEKHFEKILEMVMTVVFQKTKE